MKYVLKYGKVHIIYNASYTQDKDVFMKKFIFLAAISLSLCNPQNRAFGRSLEYVGMPIKGPQSSEGNYDAGYWIIWDKDKITSLPFLYTTDADQFKFYKIEDDKITLTQKIKIEKTSTETNVYKIVSEKNGQITALFIGEDGNLVYSDLLVIDLNNELGGSFELSSTSCMLNPFVLTNISAEAK